MNAITETLQRCPLFDGIEREHLSGMLDCLGARRMTYRKGNVIYPEGSCVRDVGILLAGQIQLIRTDYYGNRSIVMSIRPGQLFAESFACAKISKLPVSVVSAEDCEVLWLDCRRVMTSCQNACAFHSRIIYNLLQIVSEKNLALHRKALITSKRTTREKLMTYLMLEAKQAGKADITIPYDRQGLADYLEVDRSGLSGEMSKMKKEGLLDYYKSEFRLLKMPDGTEDQD